MSPHSLNSHRRSSNHAWYRDPCVRLRAHASGRQVNTSTWCLSHSSVILSAREFAMLCTVATPSCLDPFLLLLPPPPLSNPHSPTQLIFQFFAEARCACCTAFCVQSTVHASHNLLPYIARLPHLLCCITCMWLRVGPSTYPGVILQLGGLPVRTLDHPGWSIQPSRMKRSK